MQITPIRAFIHLFREQQVKSQINRSLFQLTIGSILLLLTLSILESIFYFTVTVRSGIAECFLFLFITFLFYIILRAFIHAKSIFNNSSNTVLASRFKNRKPEIGGRLLNALQLEESLENLKNPLS